MNEKIIYESSIVSASMYEPDNLIEIQDCLTRESGVIILTIHELREILDAAESECQDR